MRLTRLVRFRWMPSPPADGPLVVRESAVQRDGLFAFLLVAFTAAVVRGAIGATTTTGRVVVLVIFGGLSIGTLLVWVKRRQRSQWLEVAAGTIDLQGRNAGREAGLIRTPAA